MANETEVPAAQVEQPDPITGKFREMLHRSNSKIRKDRADTIVEDAEVMYRREIEDMKRDLNKFIRDRGNMLDLSPTDAQSLKLASDFNAQEFVQKDIKLGVDIRNLSIRIDIAEKQYQELFGKEV